MSKKLKIGIAVTSIIILVAVLIGAYIGYTNLSKRYNNLTVNENTSSNTDKYKAPELKVTDESGKTYTLNDFKGKSVVINFWASWCPPCKSEMPNFQEVYEEQSDEVEFLMVALIDGSKETKETAKGYVDDNGFTFPVYYDSNNTSAINFGVNSIPTTVLIDKDGNIVDQHIGALSKANLEALIKKF